MAIGVSKLYDIKWRGIDKLEKDLEGNNRGLIEVVSRLLSGMTEENNGNR
jgi:hypothetical protein